MTNPNVPQVLICPKCDGLNMPTATICVYCQAEVEPLIVPEEDDKHRSRITLTCLVVVVFSFVFLGKAFIDSGDSYGIGSNDSYNGPITENPVGLPAR